MAVWSIIQFSQLVDLRLDSEYYQPINLKLEKLLKAAKPIPISDFAYVTDGIHGSPDWVEENGILYLSAKCVKDNYFSLANAGKISQSQNTLNPRTQARLDDVLLTTVGTIGNAAVIDEKILPANMDRHLGIIRIDKESCINPYYLATFLNSKFGIFQTIRESTGNVQLNLFIEKIKNLLVPIGDHFNNVGKLTRKAYDKHYESESLYAETEALLLHELGLDNLDLSTQKTYIANFSETVEGDRLDADYLNPKYTNLIRHLRNLPHITLGNLATFSNGATPKGANYLEEGVPFLRIQNINKNRLNLDDVVYISRDIHNSSLKRSQLKPGDVLITITGRIGTAAVIPDNLPIANMNQHSVRLRIKDKQMNPYYLSVFLNSQGGLLQSEREAYGATREALPYYCLERLIIPLASQDLQKRIELKIREADQVSQDAKNLLEEAKHRVEKMILGEEHSINE